MTNKTILEVRELSVQLRTHAGLLTAIDKISFQLHAGEILGLVGESGSGKSVTCRALMKLLPSKAMHISGGEVLLGQEDISKYSEQQMRQVRGREVGMIFQNPSAFLDPVMRVGDIISESILSKGQGSREQAQSRAIELLHAVGIPDPASRIRAYPHEFSGGMRQRVMIAAALACEPKILIADEPTTALDVTVQAQILKLIMDLKDKFGLSVIFVTHDLGVVGQLCDRVAVMYGGTIVEQGTKDEVLNNPRHPYTQGLIVSQPGTAHVGRDLPFIQGQPPSLENMPQACRFSSRCSVSLDTCKAVVPPKRSERDHEYLCHLNFETSHETIA